MDLALERDGNAEKTAPASPGTGNSERPEMFCKCSESHPAGKCLNTDWATVCEPIFCHTALLSAPQDAGDAFSRFEDRCGSALERITAKEHHLAQAGQKRTSLQAQLAHKKSHSEAVLTVLLKARSAVSARSLLAANTSALLSSAPNKITSQLSLHV